jgi:hypothetical protein
MYRACLPLRYDPASSPAVHAADDDDVHAATLSQFSVFFVSIRPSFFRMKSPFGIGLCPYGEEEEEEAIEAIWRKIKE